MKKRFCVIGLGNFGHHMARALFEQGHEVVGIDVGQHRVQQAKDECSYAVVGDASDKEFLASQGVAEMEAVIVSTGDRSHLSTLITLFLKELEVRRILVKAVSEDHGRILQKVGADKVIYPDRDISDKLAMSLTSPNVLEYIPLAEDYSITEAAAPEHFIGSTLMDLDLRKKCRVNVVAIKDVISDQFVVVPPADYVIKDSDLLILIGKTEDVESLLNKK